MNSTNLTANQTGEKLPPSVIGGCFNTADRTMWLAFEDETAKVYTNVPRNVLKKLAEFGSPEPANDYVQRKVVGNYNEKEIPFHTFMLAQALGIEPPMPSDLD